MLGDDPSFVIDLTLPPLDFDDSGEFAIPDFSLSQGSGLSSQHSPLDHSSICFENAPFINLDIRRFSSQGSATLAPLLDENHALNDDSLFPMALGEEEDLPFAEFPIRIDADGNLVEEPELPAHPFQAFKSGDATQEDPGEVQFPDDDGLMILDDEEAQVMFGGNEAGLPIKDPAQQTVQQNNESQLPSYEPLSSDPVQQEPRPLRRQRKIKTLGPDAATQVGRSDFKAWTETYVARTQEGNNARQQVTGAQARKNAYNLVFGRGLGDVGLFNSVPGLNHELAGFFAGDGLEDIVLGDTLAGIGHGTAEDFDKDNDGTGRRRSASVAFGSENEAEGEGTRRVRLRADGEQDHQDGHSQQDAQIDEDDAMMVFGNDQDLLPEVGREHAGPALSDHRRSSNAPWNLPSSIRSGKHVEVGRNAVEQSPLIGRGSIPPSGVRFSNVGLPGLGSDGFAPFQHDGAHDLSSFEEFGVAAGVSTQEANTSQFVREALDREGRNFLGFVEHVAADHGEQDARDENLRWVEFDGLFDAQDKTRVVVAQAFLHVLTLATKNRILVKQTGVEEEEPFGTISIGITGVPQLGGEELIGEVEALGDVETLEELRGVEADHKAFEE